MMADNYNNNDRMKESSSLRRRIDFIMEDELQRWGDAIYSFDIKLIDTNIPSDDVLLGGLDNGEWQSDLTSKARQSKAWRNRDTNIDPLTEAFNQYVDHQVRVLCPYLPKDLSSHRLYGTLYRRVTANREALRGALQKSKLEREADANSFALNMMGQFNQRRRERLQSEATTHSQELKAQMEVMNLFSPNGKKQQTSAVESDTSTAFETALEPPIPQFLSVPTTNADKKPASHDDSGSLVSEFRLEHNGGDLGAPRRSGPLPVVGLARHRTTTGLSPSKNINMNLLGKSNNNGGSDGGIYNAFASKKRSHLDTDDDDDESNQNDNGPPSKRCRSHGLGPPPPLFDASILANVDDHSEEGGNVDDPDLGQRVQMLVRHGIFLFGPLFPEAYVP